MHIEMHHFYDYYSKLEACAPRSHTVPTNYSFINFTCSLSLLRIAPADNPLNCDDDDDADTCVQTSRRYRQVRTRTEVITKRSCCAADARTARNVQIVGFSLNLSAPNEER